ncbi:MAG TPA: FAD-dependent oxidoreductase [Solirubrobacteraceae bacterium]|nr:FAD-dependent oxidoreductase [Solirubrobacteraceae bacterium]
MAIVIVGGGLAAVRTVQALRDGGYEGALTVLAGEAEPPYDRPPLSKDFLLGKVADEDIRLLAPEAYETLGVELRLGARAAGLDPAAHEVILEGGERVPYEKLVVATGADPIRIPALEGVPGVHYLRDAAHSRELREMLRAGTRVGVVGGGFIGLEIAAVARSLGAEVTVIEGLAAPLAGVLGPELGGWVQELHESHGVVFRCGSPVAAAHEGVLELQDGTSLDVDVIVVGVGVRPTIGWLRDSGVLLHRGLVCDGHGRSSDPDVFAAGDVICRHDADDRCEAVEHWTAAGDQAMRAADAVLGQADGDAPAEDHYFWSDQYDVRLQFSGHVASGAALEVIHGEPSERKFVARILDGDRLTGIFGMSSPREFIRSSLELRRAAAT